MVFSEGGHNAAEAILEQIHQHTEASSVDDQSSLSTDQLKAQLQQLAPALDGDRILAEQLGADTVLGFFFHNDGFNAGAPPPAPIQVSSDEDFPGLIQMENYTANRDMFNHMFPLNGFVVTVPDGDGVVSRLPLVMKIKEGIVSLLSIMIPRLAIA